MVEIKLSDEMLEQIDAMSGLSAPENTSSVQLDFDDAGTMHVIRRDIDGKMLQDNAIQNSTSKVIIDKDDKDDFNAAQKWRQERSKIMKFYLVAGLVVIVVIRVIIAMM